MFAARVEDTLNVLPSMVLFNSELEVVHLITRRISSEFYDAEHLTVVFTLASRSNEWAVSC